MESREYYENAIKQLGKRLEGVVSEIGVLTYMRNNIQDALEQTRESYRMDYPEDNEAQERVAEDIEDFGYFSMGH